MPMAIEPLSSFGIFSPIDKTFLAPISLSLSMVELCKTHNRIWLKKIYIPQSSVHSKNDQVLRVAHTTLCHATNVSKDLPNTQLCKKSPNRKFAETEELSLLSKPSSTDNFRSVTDMIQESTKPDTGVALEPFLKIFKSKELEDEQVEEDSVDCKMVFEKTNAEYYEPKPGDFVVGVVVAGNKNKLDVNVGADLLGIMLTKEVLPFYDKEMDFLVCDLDKNDDEFMKNGRIGIIQNQSSVSEKPASGRPILDVGNVLVAEVIGKTLSGRPLLSSRHYFRRIAWHRVRQIEQLGEPIQVRISEWNTFGLLTRVEGLRAFLPKTELTWQVNSFEDLKDKVGSKMYVMINRINEAENAFVLSERDVWKKWYLQEGSLLEGTITKILAFGAVVRLGQTNKSGQLHVSNISLGKFNEVNDVLEVGEKVKVLVIKCVYPNKPSLSIADLESEPGLFISNKEKVFEEAEEMARRYRQKHKTIFTSKSEPSLNLHPEETIFANWEWFVFQSDNKP